MSRYALALTAVVLSAVPACAQAQAALGPQLARDLITLRSVAASSPSCGIGFKFDLIENPDGTETKFQGIPTGKVLVINGFEFRAGSTPRPGQMITADVLAVTSSTSFASLVRASGVADVDGNIEASVSLITGAPIKAGTKVCFVGPPGIFDAVLHGYLTSK